MKRLEKEFCANTSYIQITDHLKVLEKLAAVTLPKKSSRILKQFLNHNEAKKKLNVDLTVSDLF
jgi:hypothetical protein